MILIIDNYDSFTYNLVHLIGARTNDYKVIRNDVMDIEGITALAPDRILISPGPGRPADAGITEAVIDRFGPNVPILGVCLGHQAIGEVYGARVGYAPELMHGKTSRIFHDGKTVFNGLSQGFDATRYHSLILEADSIPDCLEISARTKDGVIMGVRHREYPVEGIQFHPESILTDEGPKLVLNWLKAENKQVARTGNR